MQNIEDESKNSIEVYTKKVFIRKFFSKQKNELNEYDTNELYRIKVSCFVSKFYDYVKLSPKKSHHSNVR